ncbi:DNA primase subunit [Martiniozyma asiatica (nom. inval.)]|nr:DNA primase subunit [Martiniozyma asiatica]
MFKKSKRRTAVRRNFEDSTLLQSDSYSIGAYPNRLSFYQQPPSEEITLDQFETYAIDRLKILIEVGNLSAQGLSYDDITKLMTERVKQLLPLHANNTIDPSIILEERKKDYYSHFILRLAFCRSEELRKKFISSETFLFKLRYSQLTKSEREEFVKQISLPWEEVNDLEKESVRDGLVTTHFSAVSKGIREGSFPNSSKFVRKALVNSDIWEIIKDQKVGKLQWMYVPDLVSQRKVFIHKGFAYVPEFLQLNLIANEYQEHLESSLLMTTKYLIGMDEDDRLSPILENLSRGYINSEVSFSSAETSENGINANNVNEFSKYFPACANRLMQGLEEKHHLRFLGRNQYQLFLKGIGLGPTEALKFWQMEFTSGPGAMTMEKFNKEYKYNLRHNYGLEGARINYKPWSCAQILSKPKPTTHEYHGCPYRDLHSDKLGVLLKRMGVDGGDLQSVVTLADKGEWQVACSKVFDVVNADLIEANMNAGHQIQDTPITHPNEYFNRALVYERRIQKGEESQ